MYVCDPRRHHQHTIRSEKTRTSNNKCNRHRKDTIHKTKEAWLVPFVACQCLCWSRDKFEDTKMIMNFTMPWIQISRPWTLHSPCLVLYVCIYTSDTRMFLGTLFLFCFVNSRSWVINCIIKIIMSLIITTYNLIDEILKIKLKSIISTLEIK